MPRVGLKGVKPWVSSFRALAALRRSGIRRAATSVLTYLALYLASFLDTSKDPQACVHSTVASLTQPPHPIYIALTLLNSGPSVSMETFRSLVSTRPVTRSQPTSRRLRTRSSIVHCSTVIWLREESTLPAMNRTRPTAQRRLGTSKTRCPRVRIRSATSCRWNRHASGTRSIL